MTAGATLAESAAVDEVSAQRVWTGGSAVNLSKPWASGKPGSRAQGLAPELPEQLDQPHHRVLGEPVQARRPRPSGTSAHCALGAHSRTLTVPAKAVPGYGYRLWIEHTQGTLQLSTWFQICTLEGVEDLGQQGHGDPVQRRRPGAGSRRRHGGQAHHRVHVRAQGHGGPADHLQAGEAAAGSYVGSFKTDGYGKFRTPLLKPNLTHVTWSCCTPATTGTTRRYTSPRKITVR